MKLYVLGVEEFIFDTYYSFYYISDLLSAKNGQKMAKLAYFFHYQTFVVVFFYKKYLIHNVDFRASRYGDFIENASLINASLIIIVKASFYESKYSICQKLSKTSNLANLLSSLDFVCNYIYQSNC